MSEKYIIYMMKDWADEFDYPICSIFNEYDLLEVKRLLAILSPDYVTEMYFGTNDCFEFNKEDIQNLLDSAVILTKDVEKVVEKLHINGLDVIDQFLEENYDV